MIKINNSLVIGDWHCKKQNLTDSYQLMGFIYKIAIEKNVDSIIFMGDQQDTHDVLSMRVIKFWYDLITTLNTKFKLIFLIGNHDLVGDRQTNAWMSNSMISFRPYPNVFIIDRPANLDNIGFMPYYKDHNELIKDANDLYEDGCKSTLFTHQNFTIPLFGDMIDPNLIKQNTIIAGHVHDTTSSNDRVFYTDTPMWLTATDCNKEKGIWYIEFNEKKEITKKDFISTKGIVTFYEKFSMSEGDIEEITFSPNSKNILELKGSSSWITAMKSKFKGTCSIKAYPIDRKSIYNKQINSKISLESFIDSNFSPVNGISKDDVLNFLKEEVLYAE